MSRGYTGLFLSPLLSRYGRILCSSVRQAFLSLFPVCSRRQVDVSAVEQMFCYCCCCCCHCRSCCCCCCGERAGPPARTARCWLTALTTPVVVFPRGAGGCRLCRCRRQWGKRESVTKQMNRRKHSQPASAPYIRGLQPGMDGWMGGGGFEVDGGEIRCVVVGGKTKERRTEGSVGGNE